MKVLTLFGTRPEIIRLSRVIPILDQFCQHVVVHTGQNHDPALSDIFFEELGLRAPDLHLGVKAENFAAQIAQIIERGHQALVEQKPDRVLILGDTNSGLVSLIAARLGIPVFHLEAGNRCYDDRVPEEVNRRAIDHASTVLMPYTNRSMENLLREGVERDRIYVIGNPIYEVLEHHKTQVEASGVHQRLQLEQGNYVLATMHRAENVDDRERLEMLFSGLKLATDSLDAPLVMSLHPRTADKLKRFGLDPRSDRLRLLSPLGFFDFVALERHARLVISDSGTVQEECAIMNVPNITLRDVTERAETIEAGSNMLSGARPEEIKRAVDVVLGTSSNWVAPPEYLAHHVSRTVAKIVLGYLGPVGRVRPRS